VIGERIRNARRTVRSVGPLAAGRVAVRRLLGRTRHPGLDTYLGTLNGASAIEIGGPSHVFRRRGFAPVYDRLASCDDVDYAEATIWAAGKDPVYQPEGRPLGRRFFREATSLDGISDETYDALLASHVLEHIANPLRALAEWKRVVRSDGTLVLVVPDMRATFDHNREVTTGEHMRDDFARGVGEDDRTHVPEVLARHDVARDPGLASGEELLRRVTENPRYRALHHHVFTLESFSNLLASAGVDVVYASRVLPHHLVGVGRTPSRH
jgi:SAM-dependent methyltransferase